MTRRAVLSFPRARAREGGEAFAEARRRERRREGFPHVRDLAAAERALAVEQRVALRVDALPHQRELAPACLELRLETVERPFPLLDRHELGRGLARLGAPAAERRGLRLELPGAPLECLDARVE